MEQIKKYYCMSNDVVYLAYYLRRRDYMTTVCVQDFDMADYNDEDFVKDSEGYYYGHEEEEVVQKFIIDRFSGVEKIDPEFAPLEDKIKGRFIVD